ncbi:hypothetical protein [Ensifer sp. 4252]|uniref:hypothetical protein n=1 Tax=Ensifer sp. 4252 TaxID=3373915 RepID=UPI003D2187F7
MTKDSDSIHLWHPASEETALLVGNGKPLAVREFQVKGFVRLRILSCQGEPSAELCKQAVQAAECAIRLHF